MKTTIASAITAKIMTIAPDAKMVHIIATLRDIHQSSYWSAAISIERLTAIYNGVSGLASREQAELILNRLEDEDIAAYIAARAANPAPAEPVEIDSEACAGCGALPGDGITASCWHSTGCGYLRELDERMADRGQYGRNA